MAADVLFQELCKWCATSYSEKKKKD